MNDTEIDERLSAYAARWRAAQPPPPTVPAVPVAARRRRWLPLVAAAAVVLIAAGTGMAITAQAHHSGRGATSAGTPLCQISDLRVLVADPGVRVTNIGRAACRFSGRYEVLLHARSVAKTAPAARGVLQSGDTYVQPFVAHGPSMVCGMGWSGAITAPVMVTVEGEPVSVDVDERTMRGLVCSTMSPGTPSIQHDQPQPCLASDFHAALHASPLSSISLTKVTPGSCLPDAGPDTVLLTVPGGAISAPLNMTRVLPPIRAVPPAIAHGASLTVRITDHSTPYCSGALPTTWTQIAVVLASNSVIELPLPKPLTGRAPCASPFAFDPAWDRSGS